MKDKTIPNVAVLHGSSSFLPTSHLHCAFSPVYGHSTKLAAVQTQFALLLSIYLVSSEAEIRSEVSHPIQFACVH